MCLPSITMVFLFGAMLIVIVFAIPKMELFDEADILKLDPCECPDMECEEEKRVNK